MKLLLGGLVLLHLVAQSTELPSWISNVSDLGIVIFLVAVMYGGVKDKPWWVTGREFRAAVFREETYREMAFRALGAGERAAKTLSKAVKVDE